jgi:hypothetical protein
VVALSHEFRRSPLICQKQKMRCRLRSPTIAAKNGAPDEMKLGTIMPLLLQVLSEPGRFYRLASLSCCFRSGCG